jgi:proteasome accessory factor C
MVPWLLAHQGVPIEDAAAEFGVSTDQLVADLELLFVCGTPGGMPDDLIEADWEDGRVFLGNADYIARPLRLSVDEALALMVGLRALATTSGLVEHDAVSRALSKLEEATGAVGAPSARVQVSIDDGARSSVLGRARDAVADHRRLHLAYLVPTRDEVTERDVDPMRVAYLDGHWYLEGWCHRAEAVRLFRLDRVVAIEVLDADGTPPPDAVGRDADERLFTPSPEDVVVTVDLEPAARWVATYYPVEHVVELGDGRLRVTLRAASADWVPRLALRLGGELRVVTPPELAEEVRRRAAEALSAYAEASTNG